MNKNNLSKFNVDCGQSDNRKNILTKMLLTPVVVDKLATSIQKEGNTWISPQIYKGAGDPDMSDLSVAFYEIVYKDILPKNKVLEELGEKKIKDFENRSFAGDTMNSFNTIVGKMIKTLKIYKEVMDRGGMPSTSDERMEIILKSDAKEETKALFRKFYCLYHSLANFWIVPMEIGRGSTKRISTDSISLDPQDYMEGFLSGVENNWSDLKKQESYSFYFKKFDGYDDFREKHFISETDYPKYIKDKTGKRDPLNEEDATAIVSGMISAIENRAELLSESKYAEQLWNSLTNSLIDNCGIQ